MEREINYFKIGFFILLIIIILIAGFFINRFYVSNAFVDGIEQGRSEVILLNSNNRFLLWNSQINQTEEWNLGLLCDLPGVR